MAVNEIFPERVAPPEQVVRVSVSGSAESYLRRLTDAPIHILAIYVFMTLVLPPFLLAINDLWPIYYRYEEFSLAPGIVVIAAVVLPCVLRHFQWSHRPEIAVTQRPIFIYSTQGIRIVGLLVAIAVSIINIGNSGFRYDEITLSERGSFSLYIYVVIPICVKLLLIFHAFVYRGTSAMDRFERVLVTMALAASINGTGTAFVTVFSFVVLQTNARDYLFKSKWGGIGVVSPLRLIAFFGIGIVVGFFVIIILTGAYIYGESVKREEPLSFVFDTVTGTSFGQGWTPDILIERLAPPYASLVNTLPLTFDFDQDSFANLVGVWNNFLFRLEALGIFRFDVARTSAMSIMRLNYEFIDIFALNSREGTAPGLIPGFLYCFPPILNVLMLGTYVFVVLGILQRVCLCMNEEMSFIGKFILTYFTLPLFESPLDIPMIIDDGFIFIAGLWLMGGLVAPVRTRFPSASGAA